MNERRVRILIAVGGLALAALLLLAGNALADNPAAPPYVAALQDTTGWSSGWVDIAPGETRTFTHDLGGDPALYAVDLWFRDTRSPGFGIHDRAYGGMDVAGQHLGAYWHNLTGDSISVTRMGDDVTAAQVRLRIWIPEPFDYDSGWMDIQPSQMITRTHNLGGDVDDYTAGMKFRDTAPGGLGIHHCAFGGLEAGGQFQGAAWQNLTNTTIQVLRFGADTAVHQVRVFITRPDPPNRDSGWLDVAQGETLTFTHDLRGNPNGYVVRVSAQSAAVGINTRAAGGLEVSGNFYGVAWQNLTGNTINVFRFPHDIFAERVRVRIWVERLPVEPSFLSATLGVGQRVTTTLTINNLGTEPLTFELAEVSGPYTPTMASSLQLRAGSGTTQVLAWTTYADLTGEYPNTIAAITQFYPGFAVTTTTTTDPAVLEAALADKDVFLVPEMENASSSTISNIATTWAGVLDTFVRRGGTIIVTDFSNGVAFFEGTGLMDVSWGAYASGYTMRVINPLHPVTEGLPPTLIGENASGYFSTTDGTVLIVHETSGQAYVAVKDIGSGHVVLIASDFYLYNDNMARLVANAVRWSGVPWLDEEPNSGTVLPGEAADVAVTFDASALAPGVYTADLLVNISDTVSSVVTVPVTMNVTEFGLSPSTKEVDLAVANPGDRLTYSIALANAGATPISVVLTDTIPIYTTYVANSVTGGATYNATEKRIEWSGMVPGGSSHTVTFQVDASKPLYDYIAILNTAFIEDLTNGISHWRQVATDIEAPVLTDSYKQVVPTTVQPGDILTFTVVMRNTGSADAVGISLQDPIPDHATYVPGSVTGGATYNAAEDRIEWGGTIPVGGSATVTFQVTADPTTKGLPIINKATIAHPWAYTTYEYAAAGVLTGADILVIEDDGTTTDARGIYTDALEANGYTRYDFFPTDYVGAPPTTTLRSYPVAILYVGSWWWGLPSADQAAVEDYLGSGGRLLLTGDYIAEGTSPRSFLTDTLHIRFVKEAPSGAKGVVGIAGEILEGVSSTIQSYYPSIIEPADPLAVPIIEYTGVTTGTAGVRFTGDNSQGVFLGFAFEKVTEQTEREEMMGRIMGWLYGSRIYLPLVLKGY